mmetsp:Transcript_15166/g.34820  ORF Transcript_15166/g.34820 Transcript_15166/m.34820 type:complete len:235 (-) Transcript_15166:934-1638(-)
MVDHRLQHVGHCVLLHAHPQLVAEAQVLVRHHDRPVCVQPQLRCDRGRIDGPEPERALRFDQHGADRRDAHVARLPERTDALDHGGGKLGPPHVQLLLGAHSEVRQLEVRRLERRPQDRRARRRRVVLGVPRQEPGCEHADDARLVVVDDHLCKRERLRVAAALVGEHVRRLHQTLGDGDERVVRDCDLRERLCLLRLCLLPRRLRRIRGGGRAPRLRQRTRSGLLRATGAAVV